MYMYEQSEFSLVGESEPLQDNTETLYNGLVIV